MSAQASVETSCSECDCTELPGPEARFCKWCGHPSSAHTRVDAVEGEKEHEPGDAESSPVDAAVTAYEGGDFETALEMLHREAFEAEEQKDEDALHDVIDVADQMAAHLNGEERRDFEKLAAAAERRLTRVRDAVLPERLAGAWKAVEALELDEALDWLQDELFAVDAAEDTEALERVADAAEEMAEVVDVGERRAFDRVRAAARRRLAENDSGAEPRDSGAASAPLVSAPQPQAPSVPLIPKAQAQGDGPVWEATSAADEVRVGGWGPALFLFGFVAGIVGWLSLRRGDPHRASHVLKWGIIWSAVGLIGYVIVIAAMILALAHSAGGNAASAGPIASEAATTPATVAQPSATSTTFTPRFSRRWL